MSNTQQNNDGKNQENNSAANITTNNTPVAGVPNKTKIVTISDNKLPPTNQGAVVQPPAGTEQQGQQVDPDDIDIGKFISESTAEIKTGEEKETERHKKTKYLTKALESLQSYERIIYNNSETGDFIGTKLQYVKDAQGEEGKSIYDYMNDPVVTEHIEFIVPEGDPQDGSPVDQQISFYWKKPTF